MASITKKSNGTWLAQVRHKAQHGRPAIHRSATFERKADAAAWAARIEEEWRMVKHGLSPCIPFRDVLQRYANEITPKKRGARSETYRLNHLMQSDLAAIMLPDLTDFTISRMGQTTTNRNQYRHIIAWMDNAVARSDRCC